MESMGGHRVDCGVSMGGHRVDWGINGGWVDW